MRHTHLSKMVSEVLAEWFLVDSISEHLPWYVRLHHHIHLLRLPTFPSLKSRSLFPPLSFYFSCLFNSRWFADRLEGPADHRTPSPRPILAVKLSLPLLAWEQLLLEVSFRILCALAPLFLPLRLAVVPALQASASPLLALFVFLG